MGTDPQAQAAAAEERAKAAAEAAAKAAEEEQAKKNELLEIYKLHAQLASDMANRLTTTNRFYLTLIFGLLAFFGALLRASDVLIPEEIDKKMIFRNVTTIADIFVVILSTIWAISIGDYCKMLSEKYKVLLKLEKKFEFRFFKNEWGQTEDIPYVQLSIFQIWVPVFFICAFFLLMLGNVILY